MKVMAVARRRLWGFLPFATVLTVIPVVTWLIWQRPAGDGDMPAFIGNGQYLSMFLADPVFRRALCNSLLPPTIVDAAVAFLLLPLKRRFLDNQTSFPFQNALYFTALPILLSALSGWLLWRMGLLAPGTVTLFPLIGLILELAVFFSMITWLTDLLLPDKTAG